MKITSSYREVRISEGSSYQESTVFLVTFSLTITCNSAESRLNDFQDHDHRHLTIVLLRVLRHRAVQIEYRLNIDFTTSSSIKRPIS